MTGLTAGVSSPRSVVMTSPPMKRLILPRSLAKFAELSSVLSGSVGNLSLARRAAGSVSRGDLDDCTKSVAELRRKAPRCNLQLVHESRWNERRRGSPLTQRRSEERNAINHVEDSSIGRTGMNAESERVCDESRLGSQDVREWLSIASREGFHGLPRDSGHARPGLRRLERRRAPSLPRSPGRDPPPPLQAILRPSRALRAAPNTKLLPALGPSSPLHRPPSEPSDASSPSNGVSAPSVRVRREAAIGHRGASVLAYPGPREAGNRSAGVIVHSQTAHIDPRAYGHERQREHEWASP